MTHNAVTSNGNLCHGLHSSKTGGWMCVWAKWPRLPGPNYGNNPFRSVYHYHNYTPITRPSQCTVKPNEDKLFIILFETDFLANYGRNADSDVVKLTLSTALWRSGKWVREKGDQQAWGMNCSVCHVCLWALTHQWIHERRGLLERFCSCSNLIDRCVRTIRWDLCSLSSLNPAKTWKWLVVFSCAHITVSCNYQPFSSFISWAVNPLAGSIFTKCCNVYNASLMVSPQSQWQHYMLF